MKFILESSLYHYESTMQQKASWCILLMLNMAVPLQQKPIAAAGYTNTAVTNTVDTGDLDIANGESDPDGYVNGEADMDTQTSATDEEPFHYILSLATGMFVAITKSGRVQANAQISKSSLHSTRVHVFHSPFACGQLPKHCGCALFAFSVHKWTNICMKRDACHVLHVIWLFVAG